MTTITNFSQIGISQVQYPDDTSILIPGTAQVLTIANATVNTNKFLVADSSGVIKYRTGAEVLSDIGGGSGGGDVSGTPGTIALFTDATSVGDSVITQNSGHLITTGNFDADGTISSLSGLSTFNELQVQNLFGGSTMLNSYQSDTSTNARIRAQSGYSGDSYLDLYAWGKNNTGSTSGPDGTDPAGGNGLESSAGTFTEINQHASGKKLHLSYQHQTRITVDSTGAGFKNQNPLGVIHPMDGPTGSDMGGEKAFMCGNVGPHSSAGSFVRDSTHYPCMTREDAGTLSDNGTIDIVYKTGYNGDFAGTGFVCSTSGDPTILCCQSNFNFYRNFIVPYNTIGSVWPADQDGSFCVIVTAKTGGNSNKVQLKNALGQTERIGYWVKY
jgi:hypothetical protein